MEQLKETIEQLYEKITNMESTIEWLTNLVCNEGEVTIPYLDFSGDEELKLPKRNREGDIGYDAYAHETVVIPPHSSAKVSLGIGMLIPRGFGVACRTRGGNWLKGLLVGPAHVDLNYRGVINALLYNVSDNEIVIEKGDRPCSIDVYKTYAIEWQSIDEFRKVNNIDDETFDRIMDTNRGDKGFGSSGK